MRADGGRLPSVRVSPDAGFTLIEALVAFAIAAMGLVALFQGSLVGLRASQVAGRYEEALTRARSRLAALETAPLTAGDRRGDDGGGYRWRVRIVPTATSEPLRQPMAGPSPRVTLYAVSVAVGWQEGGQVREVRLETQRLGSAAAP
ncbi:MAG TPA: prepilin-type N-terminal cleavage/methylation domain-containing protein [Crenalkalicoccus sp.]|nr:prepilin-type N-terminal cleavage/methylation domain-containing protein [Crenalkalicoccus sp.]